MVKVKTSIEPERVYVVPENHNVKYNYQDGVLSIFISKVDIHSVIVIEDHLSS